MVALVGALLAEPAQACRRYVPPVELTDTLLAEADESPVVAKVRILEVERRLQQDPWGRRHEALLPFTARARVLEAIKGTTAGSIVTIHARPFPCGGGLYEDQVGREGFIVGRFSDDGVVVLHRGRMYPR